MKLVKSEYSRKTKETQIEVNITLDGKREIDVHTASCRDSPSWRFYLLV